jgi:hypothetical protein
MNSDIHQHLSAQEHRGCKTVLAGATTGFLVERRKWFRHVLYGSS